MERLFEARTILDDPPVDGRVIHRHPPFFHCQLDTFFVLEGLEL
jgi:hypothetical protein